MKTLTEFLRVYYHDWKGLHGMTAERFEMLLEKFKDYP